MIQVEIRFKCDRCTKSIITRDCAVADVFDARIIDYFPTNWTEYHEGEEIWCPDCALLSPAEVAQ